MPQGEEVQALLWKTREVIFCVPDHGRYMRKHYKVVGLLIIPIVWASYFRGNHSALSCALAVAASICTAISFLIDGKKSKRP